jgi:pimeloyl-ACP methyl ester carboxylesterase
MILDNQTGLRATQFKTIDGLQIRFATNDKGGDPILLLSPLPESILAFLPTWEMFSGLGRVVAVDLPAFGLSESRANLRAPEALGEFILKIAAAFGLEQPHVVAPDVGTPACLFAAANHPRGLQKHGDRQRRDGSHRFGWNPGRNSQRPFA